MAETDYENPYQDKIDKDKKNLVKLRAGTANQQLMNAAYLGARNEPPAVTTWMNAAESGLTSFTEAIDKSRKARQAEVDKMNGEIDTQIDTLTTTGFSLGETYYGAANEYTKQLREKYLAAEGNPEEQNKIKMELNVASQNIGTTKQAIEDIATAWGINEDESTLERSALDPKQKDIIKTVTNDANAIWDYEKNTFVWKNQDPNSDYFGETYTADQIQDIQKIASKDYDGKKTYIDSETTIGDNGNRYANGEGGSAFNSNTQMHANKKLITKDNIRFYIHGDFTGDGTPSFKDEVLNHPEWDHNIFYHLQGVVDENGNMTYDINNDGYVSAKDFGGEEDDAEGEARSKIMEDVYTAITEPASMGYDFEVTKGLIAEYMTLRQEKKFYGGKMPWQLEQIKPDDLDAFGNPLYTGTKEYIAAGGNIGYAEEVMGYTWSKDIKNKKGKSTTPKTEGWVIDPNKEFQKQFVKGTGKSR